MKCVILQTLRTQICDNYQILMQLDELLQRFHQPMLFMFNYHQYFISKKKKKKHSWMSHHWTTLRRALCCFPEKPGKPWDLRRNSNRCAGLCFSKCYHQRHAHIKQWGWGVISWKAIACAANVPLFQTDQFYPHILSNYTFTCLIDRNKQSGGTELQRIQILI